MKRASRKALKKSSIPSRGSALAKLGARIAKHPTRGTPQMVTDFSSPPLKGNLETAARRFIASVAPDLDVDPKDLVFDRVVSSPLGKHVFFQQRIGGDRVTGAFLKLDVDQRGRVYQLTNNCLPPDSAKASFAKQAVSTSKEISAQDAIERAAEHAGIDPASLRAKPKAERVMLPVDHHAEPAWKILISSMKPLADLRVYVSRATGRILKKDDLLKMGAVKAFVFDPSPLIALDDSTLTEKSKLPENAYRSVELPDVKPTGHLDGRYVTTAGTKARAKIKNGSLTARRGSTAFKEAMAYFHIDRAQRYLRSLGFSGINNRPIGVDVSGTTEDNSFYSPITKSLSFGTGGVDDAEDAEIILHEYGHSIQDAQNPGFGPDGEARAMGEGFGDYFAASFFEERKPARFRHLVGSWDAVAYSDQDPPYLRRLDSTKLYPRDKVGEEHADGEIWSACLWQIRDQVGRERMDRLTVSHHYLIGREATFKQAAEALIRADKQLYQGAHAKQIAFVFVKRGILPSPKKKRGYDPTARINRPSL
jgi:Zn-dependent metalloprotease